MTKEERHQYFKKKTAAYEALVLCRRFYPWRVKRARARVVVQMIQDTAPKDVRIATGFMEAMLEST